MVDWTNYEIYDPGLDLAREDASRQDAEAAFKKLMEEKEARIRMLIELTAQNGASVDASDAGVARLERWFRENLQEGDEPGRLEPRWYSVVNDTALFLGDVIINRTDNLSWEFSVRGGASSVQYQRPVIYGFTRSEDPHLAVDPDLDVAAYAHAIIEGDCPDEGAFQDLIDFAANNA